MNMSTAKKVALVATHHEDANGVGAMVCAIILIQGILSSVPIVLMAYVVHVMVRELLRSEVWKNNRRRIEPHTLDAGINFNTCVFFVWALAFLELGDRS